MRKISLDPLSISDWRWEPFLSHAINSFSNLDLYPCSIGLKFLEKQGITGPKSSPYNVQTKTWAAKTEKLSKVRAACVKAGEKTAVFNLVAIPSEKFDIPFFGADFVTLPSGHLIALDLQPILKNDLIHMEKYLDKIMPSFNSFNHYFPDGGKVPEKATKYFSPAFIWTRLPLGQDSEDIINGPLMSAFSEYLNVYLDLVCNAQRVSTLRSVELFSGKQDYMNYRAENDPARGMLTRFHGAAWTEEYIKEVLFSI